MILLAIAHGQPREMGIIQALQYFINHRVEVVRRRTAYLLAKAQDREHILEGYLTALDHLDNVITIIRASANRSDARENLVAYFGGKKIDINTTGRAPKLDPEKPFTAKQADAILELQLHRLTKLSIDEISNELKEIRDRITEYQSILGSEKKLRGVIIKELEEVKEQYGDARKTVIEDEAAEIHLEDLIADEQVAVTVSHSGYLKRTPISTYRMQRRGGTGRTGMKTRDEDFVEQLFVASTHAYILIFTSAGRVYWLKVYEIPDVGPAGKGKHMGNLISLQAGETVRTMLAVRDLEEANKYVFFVTRNGTVKKTELKDFSHVMSRGIIAINIEQGDELVAATLTDGLQIIFLASHEGQAVRFEEDDVRSMGRNATGVRGMNLADKDYIVGMATTPKPGVKVEKKEGDEDLVPEKGSLILSVTENGYGKRTPADEYRLTNRGGKGVINVKTTERNGKVSTIAQVSEDSQVMPEAAEAQLKIANIHYQQMEKPDRDYTHAKRAEDEYRNLILQYPDSKLLPEAKQRLLEVQEVLGEREFEIGRFYYLRQSYPAAIARLSSLVDRYPLYSGADETLYLLGQCYEGEITAVRAKPIPEALKARVIEEFTKKSAEAYDKILTRYPLTDRTEDAKKRLEALHQTIPTPTKEAIAQNKAEEDSRRATGMVSHVMAGFKKHPDVAKATKVGEPPLTDPKGMSATEFSQEVQAALMPHPPGGEKSVTVVPTDGSAPPPPNEPAPRSDSPAIAGAPAPAPAEGSAPPPAPSSNELQPNAPPDPNELKVDPAEAGTAVPPPAQVNEIQNGAAPAAAADSSSSSSDTPTGKASTSKKKKKKGLGKLNPF